MIKYRMDLYEEPEELVPCLIPDENGEVYAVSDVDKRIAELEARIDALMLEHCPDEMTQEQKDRWAAAQRASHSASGKQ